MFMKKKKSAQGDKTSCSYAERMQVWANQKEHSEQAKQEYYSNDRSVHLFPALVKEIGGNKWGYINSKGKFILPPIYDHAGDFQENGLAVVRLKGQEGIINTNGYSIVKPKYETIHPFSEGRAAVIDHGRYKVIDESGKELTTKAYSYIGDFQEGRAQFAETDEKGRYLYGYLNKRGKEVLPAAYESASDFIDGKAIVKMDCGPYALINLTGKVLKTYQYPFVGYYGGGLLAFQKNSGGKFGYLNEAGSIVIETKFTGVQAFMDSCAIVNVEDEYGLIDRTGKYIFKPAYNDILHLGEARIAIGKAIDTEKPIIGSMYGVADTSGRHYTGFIFGGISKYVNEKSSAYNEHDTFFIDKNGNRIEDLPSVSGSGEMHCDKKLIKANIDFHLLYFEKSGALVWKQNDEILLNDQYSVLEKKYKPNKDFLVNYPEISGIASQKTLSKINQFLKDLSGIKETPAHLQLESNYFGDFEVPFYKRDLLVIEITGYNYPFGATHGVPVKKYAHIDLKNGDIYHFNDLFKPGSQYVKIISEIIGNQIRHSDTYSYVFHGSYKGIQADQPFYISKNGLNIYFAPYEIAPYAAGFPAFSIAFGDIISIIDQSGPFWRSFH